MRDSARGVLAVAGLLALFYGAIQVGWPFVVIVAGALMVGIATQK